MFGLTLKTTELKPAFIKAGLTLVVFLIFTTPWEADSRVCDFAPTTGQNRVLVILANFSDTSPAYNVSDFQDLFFGDTAGTLKNYYSAASYGQLDLVGDVYGWFTVSGTHDYYGNDNYGYGDFPANFQGLAAEALDMAETSGVDFSQYDNNGDGCVDSLIVVHQGMGGEYGGGQTNIRSQFSTISYGLGTPKQFDGVHIDRFAIVPEIEIDGTSLKSFGTIAHEYGHLLGMTELYDKDGSSYITGNYDLMSIGLYGLLPSAYTRARMGWLTPLDITTSNQGVFELPSVQDSGYVLKAPGGHRDEYFLIENRTRAGYDASLPDEGLAIWHVDERSVRQNNNELVGCGPFVPLLSLEQADGSMDLEYAVNWGDTGDFFHADGSTAAEFHSATSPDSLDHQCRLSGVSVTDIGPVGNTVAVTVKVDDYRPSLPYPVILVEELSWIESSGDGDTDLEDGEYFYPRLTLVNNGTTAYSVTAAIDGQGPAILLNGATMSFPDMGPGDTASGVSLASAYIQPGFIPGRRENISITVLHSGGTTEHVTVAVPGEPKILYVDDDGGSHSDIHLSYYLREQGFFFDTWEVFTQGEPTETILLNYEKVIWITGPVKDKPLSNNEIKSLESYLDGGGNLFLASPYLLYNPTPQVSAFATNYLHISSWSDGYALNQVIGMPGDPVSYDDHSFRFAPFHMYLPVFNRSDSLVPDSESAGSLTDINGDFVGIRYPAATPASFRTFYASFSAEAFHEHWVGGIFRRILNGFEHKTGKPIAVRMSQENLRPKTTDQELRLTGINMDNCAGVFFPEGEIDVTAGGPISSNLYSIIVNVDYNAYLGWHDMVVSAIDGDTIRLSNMLKISGGPVANKVPVADAGADIYSSKSDTVTLDGSSSYDPDYDALTYKWTQLSGPAVTLSPSDTVSVANFTPDPGHVGDYVFELTVSDPWDSDGDTLRVTVYNTGPQADAGPDSNGFRTDIFTLDGTSSSDPDGDPLTYSWTRLAGPEVTLSPSDTTSAPSFSPDPNYIGDYLFELEVSDPWLSSSDTVRVTVENRAPVAEAGSTVDAIVGDTVYLDGTGSDDPDGDALSYTWEQVDGTTVTLDITDPSRPFFSASVSDIYQFSLMVSDGFTSSGTDHVKVYIRNEYNSAPNTDAGPDQSVTRDVLVTLDGSSTYDIDFDPITYLWNELSGPPVTLQPSDTAKVVTFTPDPGYVGDYLFELVASDPYLSSGDTVRITVINNGPVADAGADVSGQTGSTVQLDGSGSYDPDGDLLSYAWTQMDGDAVVLDESDPERPIFVTSSPGNYLFELVVSDSFLYSSPDTVEAVVTSPGNTRPAAEAGADIVSDWYDPAFVSLDGTASSDAEGDTLSYEWTMVEKPSGSAAVLSDPYSATPQFDDDVAGIYRFALRVHDGEVYSELDGMTVECLDNLDNDGDGTPDYYDSDDDNDDMPDWWENETGLDPFDPADGDIYTLDSVTDPDGDGLQNIHEMMNGSDPLIADAVGCPSDRGGCYFGEGNGDFIPDPGDLSVLGSMLLGSYSPAANIYPSNGDNLELDGDALISPGDYAAAQNMIISGTYYPGRPALVTLVSPGWTVSASVGDTVRLTVRVGDDPLEKNMVSDQRSGVSVIFESAGDSVDLIGGEGEALSKGTVKGLSQLNSDYEEPSFAMADDELEVIVASSRPGGAGNFDLYISSRPETGQSFSAPQPIESLNTSYSEFAPSLSADGLELYFARNTDGNGWDIYKAGRPDRSSAFGTAAPLDSINTSGYDGSPSISSYGLTLYFCVYSGSTTGYDIYTAVRPDTGSSFTRQGPLSEVNSQYLENSPSITRGGKALYFFSNRPAENNGYNVWLAERSSTSEPFGAPIELVHVNTDKGDFKTWESPDGERLYLSTYGFDNSGLTDLFMVRRPNTSVPFWVFEGKARYDVTGEMAAGTKQDSGGRASMVVRPTTCGDHFIAVHEKPDDLRNYQAIGLPNLITISVPCP